MNLNPNDDHIMDYTTGWDDNYDIGNTSTALFKDYLSKEVWNIPVNRIAIARHQKVGNIYLWDRRQFCGNSIISVLQRFQEKISANFQVCLSNKTLYNTIIL